MKNSQYIAVTASAGSGKTYTLIKNFLIICLGKPNNHEAIKHILALTFTNKAANEMKARLIEWLTKFTQPNYSQSSELQDIQRTLRASHIEVSVEELNRRSQKTLDYVLHHYSLLSIGTIDKFNAKLIRSFSYELGLAHQFNLEIQSEPFLIEAVDSMLDQIGENQVFSKHVMAYIQSQLEDEVNPNLSTLLYNKAKHYDSDIHAAELEKNKAFDWDAYETVNTQIRTEIKTHKSQAIELVKTALELIESNGLSVTDFYGGKKNGLGLFFTKCDGYFSGEIAKFPIPSNEEGAIKTFDELHSATGKSKIGEIEAVLEPLKDYRLRIIDHHIQGLKKQKIQAELLGLKVNSEIREQLAQIEKENDLVLISKFNLMIQEHIRNEPSAFIYEKIGTQYHHFFFDEFQDTSRIQWNNISPLRDEAIASENHSFTLVGDPKQSIYRFRGGDSELMLEITSGREAIQDSPTLRSLDTNYRSSQAIVKFNNELYSHLAKSLNPEHQLLFSSQAQQIGHKEELGRLKIHLSEQSTIPLFFEDLASKMHRDIQDCLNHGFSFSDLTILCTKKDHIVALSESLGALEVDYNGQRTTIKTISEKGLALGSSLTLQALIQFFHWQLKPSSKEHLVNALYLLNELGRIEIKDFSLEMLSLVGLGEKDLLQSLSERYNLNLQKGALSALNLYNYIEAYTNEFESASKETSYLLNFLEAVFAFTQNQGMGLGDFLHHWEEEAKDTAIQTSDSIDAITLMTIHSAKGLQFPVVFLPLLHRSRDTFRQWLPVENYGPLKSVNLGNFTDAVPLYDLSAKTFNEENFYHNEIDRLCVTYVATTRPEEQLFLYLQKDSEKSTLRGIHDFIQTKNPENLLEFDLYPEIDNSFTKQAEKKSVHGSELKIQQLNSTQPGGQNIRIATPSRNYQSTIQTVRVGLFVHEILEQISDQSQIEPVLKRYLLEGTVTLDEHEQISKRLRYVIEDPNYAPYFATGVKVLSEIEIMVQENGLTKTYRVDRLVETDEGLIVIDFKTGSPSPSHQKQLDQYRRILEQIGRKVAKTELIYL